MTKRETLDAAARGEGCLGRSADDEPVFVLAARDATSSSAVLAWVQLAAAAGSPDLKLRSAIAEAQAMATWRVAHGGGKVPD